MQLDVAALQAHLVLEPAPGGVESLAHGHADVLVMLVVDGDLGAGDLEVDTHDELLALALVAPGELDHDPAAHETRMEMLQPLRVLADQFIELLGVRDIAQSDLCGQLHVARLSRRAARGLDPRQQALAPRECNGAPSYKLYQLLYLMAPAYFANMAPPFLKYWKGWNRPISARWLGAHKTVGGFLLGLAVAVSVAGAQAAIDWQGSLVPYHDWPLIGLALGFGALGGDALKSFIKRARGVAPGESWVPADQLDFVLGALILVSPWARLGWSDAAIIVAVSFVGDIAVNHAAYRLRIRDSAW